MYFPGFFFFKLSTTDTTPEKLRLKYGVAALVFSPICCFNILTTVKNITFVT